MTFQHSIFEYIVEIRRDNGVWSRMYIGRTEKEAMYVARDHAQRPELEVQVKVRKVERY